MPENLDYVFGQTKAQHGNDFKYIEHDIETCKQLLTSIVSREKIKSDLADLGTHHYEYEINKQEIAKYQAELKALNWSNKTPKRDSKRGRESNTLVDDEQLLKRVSTDSGGAFDDDENNDRNRKRKSRDS